MVVEHFWQLYISIKKINLPLEKIFHRNRNNAVFFPLNDTALLVAIAKKFIIISGMIL